MISLSHTLTHTDTHTHSHTHHTHTRQCCSEELYEDETFPSRKEAALLASRVYYHLDELDDALHFALAAGNAFNVEDTSLYVTTITGWAMDTYVQQRQETSEKAPDASLEAMANRMLNRCLDDGEFKQVRLIKFLGLGEGGGR